MKEHFSNLILNQNMFLTESIHVLVIKFAVLSINETSFLLIITFEFIIHFSSTDLYLFWLLPGNLFEAEHFYSACISLYQNEHMKILFIFLSEILLHFAYKRFSYTMCKTYHNIKQAEETSCRSETLKNFDMMAGHGNYF